MSKSFFSADKNIADFFESFLNIEDPIYNYVERRCEELEIPKIHINLYTANLIKFFLTILKPKKVLEIGTHLGYSASVFARFSHKDVCVYTLEKNSEMLNEANNCFLEFKLTHKIKSYLGNALNLLQENHELKENNFDLVFIDANKSAYKSYLDFAIHHLNNAGVIMVDNIFALGRIHLSGKDFLEVGSNKYRNLTLAMRDFLSYSLGLKDFNSHVFSTSDGLLVLKKR